MGWIETKDKSKKPEDGKTYWVTVDMIKPFLMAATYKDGRWMFDESELINVVAWYDMPQPEPYPIPTREGGYDFPDFEVNENGNNKKIKVNILPDDEMRALGFTDANPDYWTYSRMLIDDISFTLMISKSQPGLYRLDVLDENFLQPYDYQSILAKDAHNIYALKVMEQVEHQMELLKLAGIISNHIRGEYI